MASELRILGRRKRVFYNKLKIMYTIEDFKNVKCLILHDGTLDELNKVLTYAYPNGVPSSGSCKHYISTGSDWLPVPDLEVQNLPKQSVKDFLNQINKQMRKITWRQANEIIHIACDKWANKLADQWGSNIVLGKEIEIKEEFYREMRAACTDAQNKLFDEIFGKDVPECPYKDGDPVWVRDREDQTWLFRYSTGKFENERIQVYEFQKKSGIYSVWNLHMPFDPNNLPVNL